MYADEFDKSKGYLTETTTYFGRNYVAFKSLENELKKEKHSFMNCLVIGPGIDNQSHDMNYDVTRTFQPFELANILMNSSVPDYFIDVCDINLSVLNELQKSPTYLQVPELSKACTQYDSKLINYYNSFFKNNTISSTGLNRIVKIPEDISSKINLYQSNIIIDELPKEKYDIVICTVLLSHYDREITKSYNDPVVKTLRKIENSIKSQGYLMDTEKEPKDNNWEDVYYNSDENGLVHKIPASIFRKK
jgi:hypothetical protein